MNEERVLQAMPVGMGYIKGFTHTTYWVRLPRMRKDVPEHIARITAFKKAKKRRQILKKVIEWCYAGVTLGCIVTMTITLLNMVGMI